MNRRPDPLDANERALAELLARDALPGPSPQLDARILAAARAASKPAPALRRPRPRWIAGMGIAATLVLAVGIAWRLRPLPERPVARTIPVAGVRVVEPHTDSAGAAADEVVAPQPQPQARELPRAIPVQRESAAAPKPLPEPPVVFDEPSPMDTQAPPPAPPPPAPADAFAPAAKAGAVASMPADTAPATQKQRADSHDGAKSLDRVEATGSRIPASAPQAFSREASGLDAAAAANAAGEEGVSRAVLDEEPPATADSPQVRDAWLQRIRELLAAGETDAARNSLAEFRKRYPKYSLPEDLRRLATP
jgi:hypothetical protein